MTYTSEMDALAVVIEEPERLAVRRVELVEPAEQDVVVSVEWSGISTGTERLLWTGTMPAFPGMGYPLVPGYESVGRIVQGSGDRKVGERVFVPGSKGFEGVRGLFGGAASHLVVDRERVIPLDESLAEQGTLLALAATARHAVVRAERLPDLVIGHGVLGRLVARWTVAQGGQPVVWEKNPVRREGARGYETVEPGAGLSGPVGTVIDVSGYDGIVDELVPLLAPRGRIVLAGFYGPRTSFAFPAAFMKEIELRIAAEWRPDDLPEVMEALKDGRLDLDGLITHRATVPEASAAYRTAFGDPTCLKMLLDWRTT
jgi:bacteriochlorophyllide a dehydrogenase